MNTEEDTSIAPERETQAPKRRADVLMTWGQTIALVATILAAASTLGVIGTDISGNIQDQIEEAAADRRAMQAEAAADRAEAAADRRAMQATMDAFRAEAAADRKRAATDREAFQAQAAADRAAFREELHRLAERQAHVEGAMSLAASQSR